ncbi:F-box/kelch-repeat protein At3g23880-like [Lotus japonicus]|uniref:F-box/kelch-repeat protein At3g23880-like n=1 Tax=Lotus japonicus TaxID=34305 RepID=UPI002589E195|nr:F-box/kelch-repeat protein At3g23880-like [Lotus japonicus]
MINKLKAQTRSLAPSLPCNAAFCVRRRSSSSLPRHMEKQMGDDLITEILLRLPVKSLVRFKAVCKFWRSLISDPQFATSHFERAALAPRLVFITPHGIRTVELEESLHPDHISEPIDYDFSSPHDDYNFKNPCPSILGSCRGFLLMRCDRGTSLYLWNPSTHVHKPIPLSLVDDTNVINHAYGFGYHSSKDDYLVVRVSITETSLSDVQFFSFRANMWKYAESVDFPSSFTSTSTQGVDLPTFTNIELCVGLLFNEAIHWVGSNWVAGRTTFFIIAFDLMEKRLLEIPRPVDLYAHDFLCFTLWVHRGFFSLSVVRRDTIEIWVMKKYKVQSSWAKTLVISLNHLYPLCSTKGGDIVMLSGLKLTKYSDEGVQGEQQLECINFGTLNSAVPLYTESMLSLPDVCY